MAKTPPANKPHRFKPGHTGNPKGSSAKARENKAIRRLTSDQVAEVGTLLLNGNIDALRDLARAKDASVLQVWMASLIVKSISTGNSQNYSVLMERIIGRVRMDVTLSGDDANPLRVQTGAMTDAEKAARADALAKLRAQIGDD